MEKITYPKCGEDKKVKRGFALSKQRFLCKNCGCNYTRSEKKGHSEKEKQEAIRYHNRRNLISNN